MSENFKAVTLPLLAAIIAVAAWLGNDLSNFRADVRSHIDGLRIEVIAMRGEVTCIKPPSAEGEESAAR